MKRVLLKSVYDAFDYVMDHYAPFGLEDQAPRRDTYAVISIQDSAGGGFGFRFCRNEYCLGALTLLFDDTLREIPGTVLFSRDHARAILDFIRENQAAETLLIHCYGGQSRSRAVAAFAVKLLGGDNRDYFKTGRPNEHVLKTLEDVLAEESGK